MRISNKSWADYAKAMSAINKKASEKMKTWIESNGIDDAEAMIQYAYALVTKYGEASSALACEMYDIIASRDEVNLPAAEPAPTATYSETAKAVNGAALRGSGMIPGAVDRLTKQAGQDTTLINAIRDGAEFAWIPSGDTCAFCITLASNGWQLASKKTLRGDHADHIHANCDCAFAIRHGKDGDVAGYDPERYLLVYKNADGLKPKDKINAMRRANYAKNKVAINARKREIYNAKKGVGVQSTWASKARPIKNESDLLNVSSSAIINMKNQTEILDYFDSKYKVKVVGFPLNKLFALKATLAGIDDILSKYPNSRITRITYNAKLKDYGRINLEGEIQIGAKGLQSYGTGVHEAIHALDYSYDLSDGIVKQALKDLGVRKNSKAFEKMAFEIMGFIDERHKFDEVFAYAIETEMGKGKGNDLSRAIYKLFKEAKI